MPHASEDGAPRTPRHRPGIELSWPEGAEWLGGKGTGRDAASDSSAGSESGRLLIVEALDVSCASSVEAFASRLTKAHKNSETLTAGPLPRRWPW